MYSIFIYVMISHGNIPFMTLTTRSNNTFSRLLGALSRFITTAWTGLCFQNVKPDSTYTASDPKSHL